MEEERPIKNLKINYKGNTYDNITYFSISNWDGKERVSFTNKENRNTTTNINCSFSDIEIINNANGEMVYDE